MAIRLQVTVDHIKIGDRDIAVETPLDEFEELLGSEYRIHCYGPTTESTNRAVIFDSLGFYLFQHHQTRLIHAISVVYDVALESFSLATAYGEPLVLYGTEIPTSPAAYQLPQQVFSQRRFGNIYSYDPGGIRTSLELDEEEKVRHFEFGLRRG